MALINIHTYQKKMDTLYVYTKTFVHCTKQGAKQRKFCVQRTKFFIKIKKKTIFHEILLIRRNIFFLVKIF